MTTINVNEMPFPLINFFKDIFTLKKNPDSLVNWNQLALKSKDYEKAIYVDAKGVVYRIVDARFLRGRGPLWGYNLGFNRLIKVDLDFSAESESMSINEIKTRMFSSFKKWEGWKQHHNYSKIRSVIKVSDSLPELIAKLNELM